MNQPNPAHPRLPLLQPLRNTNPKLQPNTLPRRRLNIALVERLPQRLHTPSQPRIILLLHLGDLRLRLGTLAHLLNRLLNIHHLHQQLRIKRVRPRPVLRRDIDPMELPQDVLRAEKRVRERAVGFVDRCGERLGGLLCRARGVLVRVDCVLEL